MTELGLFFKKHVDFIINNGVVCSECGVKLRGNTSEVAHILPKNYYKSIATCDDNVVYLCGLFSVDNCHSSFDSSRADKIKEMKIYPILQERFKLLLDRITEKINYKTYDLYE